MSLHRNKPPSLDPTAVQLLEESVQLLRAAPLSTFVVYYAASALWVFGFLCFWAYTTWFAPTAAEVAAMALGLLTLFVVLKGGHALFCGRLLAQRLGDPMPKVSLARASRAAVTQAALHSWGLILLPICFVLTVPAGWVYAFFQSATVLEFSKSRSGSVLESASREAQRWPAQNHLGLLYLSVLGGACLVNFGSGFYVVPWLANRLLGLQTVFGLQGWNALNSTFLICVLALTWLAVDPLLKTFYVLRIFYGQSQHTGEDLLGDLGRVSAPANAPGAGCVGSAGGDLSLLRSVFLRGRRAARGQRAGGKRPPEGPDADVGREGGRGARAAGFSMEVAASARRGER